LDQSHIRRGSNLLEHKLSLPHLKSTGNADDLLEKLGSRLQPEQTKRLKRSKRASQASESAAPNPKLELLRDMNLLIKGPNQKSLTHRYNDDNNNYYNFADGHIHRH